MFNLIILLAFKYYKFGGHLIVCIPGGRRAVQGGQVVLLPGFVPDPHGPVPPPLGALGQEVRGPVLRAKQAS